MKTLSSRRDFLGVGLATAAAAGAGGPFLSCSGRKGPKPVTAVPTARDTLGLPERGKKIPIILDTDIGGDIDDTWALILALKCPELDIKLVCTDGRNTTYRARLAAKLLEACGRSDIPVAVGMNRGDEPGPQSAWVGDYRLEGYPGTVYRDGVDAIVRIINESPEPVTLVAIGGVPNLAAVLERDPGVVHNARFIGMHGCIRRGWFDNRDKVVAESNVEADPKALAAVFAAPWECTITPLDTCGVVVLDGERYQKVRNSPDPAVRVLMENYDVWTPSWPKRDVNKTSDGLPDTVAIYLAFSEDLVEIENLPIGITDDGMTVIDNSKRPIRCATSWKNLDAYHDLLVDRLIG